MAKRRQKIAKPTLEYLLALQSEMETQYAEQDEQIERLREVRELKRKVQLDDDYRFVSMEVRDPTITDECQRVSAILSVNPPKLQVTPGKPSDKAQLNATLRENWTEGVLEIAGSRRPGPNTFQRAVDATVSDGGGWTKLLFTKDLWDVRYSLRESSYLTGDVSEAEAAARYNEDTEEAKKMAGPPFTWLCCDARSIYPVWQGTELGEMLEVTERPQSSTFRQYRLGRTGDGNIIPDELGEGSSEQKSGTVTFVEHWDSEWCTYLVCGKNNSGKATGQVVQQWRHGYGRVPYFFSPGVYMNYWRNRKVGWSVAESKRYLVEYRSFLWTLLAQVAARDTVPIIFREIPEQGKPRTGKDGQPIAPQRYQLGYEIYGNQGEKMQVVQFPQAAEAIRTQIALVTDAIDRLDTPRVQGPIGSGLEGAGFAINQVLSEARIRHDPLGQGIEHMLVEVTRFLWHLVRTKVKESVWVYQSGQDRGWLSAGPDDLSDTVGIKWILDPEKPSAKLIEIRAVHERVNAGTMSLDQAVEALGDEPSEVNVGRAVDRIRQTPWYVELYDRYVMEEVGMGELIQQAQQIAQTGMLANGMMPPAMGNGVVPDMANLAMAPGGGGMGLPSPNPMGAGQTGAIVPQQAAAAGMLP